MSNARNLADLLDSTGDVKSDALDNVPASNDASALTTGTLDSARLPSSGVSASSLTTGTLPVDRVPYVGRRNLIINGDMQVAQRGTSFTINSSWSYTLDRFKGYANASDGVFTVEQSTTAPAGFKNSAKITVTTADSSIGSTQLYMWGQAIEGQNMAHLKYGTSDAQETTLSFWVRSSMTGTHGVCLVEANGASGGYPTSYTINTADTWEYKTITIPGDTAITTWQTGTNAGILINFDLGCGSSYRGTANSWTTANNTYGTTGANELIGTLNATLYITGLQLEVGSVATPFEHKSYGEELALCQRYYEIASGGFEGAFPTQTNYLVSVPYKATKRTSPTVTKLSGTENCASGTTATGGNQDPQNSGRAQATNVFLTNSAGKFFYVKLAADAEL